MKATSNAERMKELDYRTEMMYAVREVADHLNDSIKFHTDFNNQLPSCCDHELAAKVRQDLLAVFLEMVLN